MLFTFDRIAISQSEATIVAHLQADEDIETHPMNLLVLTNTYRTFSCRGVAATDGAMAEQQRVQRGADSAAEFDCSVPQ